MINLSNIKELFFISVFPPPYGGVSVWNQRILKELENMSNVNVTVYSLNHKKIIKRTCDSIIKMKSHHIIRIILKVYLSVAKSYMYKQISFLEVLKSFSYIKVLLDILSNIDIGKHYKFYTSHASFKTLILSYLFDNIQNSEMIVHAHGSGVIEYAEKRPKVVKYILNRSEKIIVASEYMRNICKIRGSEKDNIITIPCGINFEKKHFKAKENYIMFCASLIEHKDPISYIQSIPYVLDKIKDKDLKFYLVGHGILKDKIIDEIEKNDIKNNVEILGEIPNNKVQELFCKAKIFVLPSKREPFGIVLIEAMSNYTPCVITNIGGMPEIVDSNCGRIVNVSSPKEIADAIVYLLKDEEQYTKLAMNAYEKSKQYDMELVAKKFYDEIINK